MYIINKNREASPEQRRKAIEIKKRIEDKKRKKAMGKYCNYKMPKFKVCKCWKCGMEVTCLPHQEDMVLRNMCSSCGGRMVKK